MYLKITNSDSHPENMWEYKTNIKTKYEIRNYLHHIQLSLSDKIFSLEPTLLNYCGLQIIRTSSKMKQYNRK